MDKTVALEHFSQSTVEKLEVILDPLTVTLNKAESANHTDRATVDKLKGCIFASTEYDSTLATFKAVMTDLKVQDEDKQLVDKVSQNNAMITFYANDRVGPNGRHLSAMNGVSRDATVAGVPMQSLRVATQIGKEILTHKKMLEVLRSAQIVLDTQRSNYGTAINEIIAPIQKKIDTIAGFEHTISTRFNENLHKAIQAHCKTHTKNTLSAPCARKLSLIKFLGGGEGACGFETIQCPVDLSQALKLCAKAHVEYNESWKVLQKRKFRDVLESSDPSFPIDMKKRLVSAGIIAAPDE